LDLAALEAEAFLLGQWNNFEELEEKLNLDELMAILNAKQNQEFQRNKFMAALQGATLEEPGEKDEPKKSLADIMAEKERELDPNAPTREQSEYRELGIEVVEVD
jgi:hypothetical protein